MTARACGDGLEIRSSELLKPYTTFKIGGPARHFANIKTSGDLSEAIEFAQAEREDTLVLGGGSNVLISDAGFSGLVAHPVNDGMAVVNEDADAVTLRINAAETWDNVVEHAVARGWWGIENLSHIPGQAGAALVQNIGAYGQQIGDVLERAEVMDIRTGEVRTLGIEECQLAYRKSLFNTSARGRFFILGLTLKLSKLERPNLQYADVKAYFDSRTIRRPAQLEIRKAIVAIRDRKFPFPREEKGGNAGSFFKNLVLTQAEYDRLEANFRKNFSPNELARLREFRNRFQAGNGIKIPTAFLMEACGLKGCRAGRAEVNETQPLVLLNQGGATAADVMRLAKRIRQTIYERTGMAISIEPELIGFRPAEMEDYLALE
jgi:UDP-N-acetylmuramate dehydrogenase